MSYGTNAGADLYHSERGNASWAALTEAQKNIARLRASDFIDYAFRNQFPGCKTNSRSQLREWPRAGAYDTDGYSIEDDEIPIEVEYAGYEAALREASTPGSLMPDYNPANQFRSVTIEGALEIEYAAPYGAESVQPIIPIIGGILARVLVKGGSKLVGEVIRA